MTLVDLTIPYSVPQYPRDRGRSTKWFLTCVVKMLEVTASSLHYTSEPKLTLSFPMAQGCPICSHNLLPSINQNQSWTSKQHSVREQLQPNTHRKGLLELSNTLTGFILSVARRDNELQGQ